MDEEAMHSEVLVLVWHAPVSVQWVLCCYNTKDDKAQSSPHVLLPGQKNLSISCSFSTSIAKRWVWHE